MQRYFVEITIHATDHPDRERVRQALEAALEHSTAREALDEALFRESCAAEVFPPGVEVVNEINRRHFFEVDPNLVPSLYRRSNPCW